MASPPPPPPHSHTHSFCSPPRTISKLRPDRGEAPPPPKKIASDNTLSHHIGVTFLSSIVSHSAYAYHTRVEFSLFKLSQVSKCLSFHALFGGGTLTPYSCVIDDGFPLIFEILGKTLPLKHIRYYESCKWKNDYHLIPDVRNLGLYSTRSI